MTQFRVMAAFAVSGLLAASPVAAQGKSGTHGGGATTHGKPTTTTATHGKSGDTATHGKSSDTATHGKSDDTATHGKSADARDKDRHAGTQTTTTTSSGPSALSTKISSNPEKLAQITPMLPDGMTLEQATAGFRNQGQFIAALNASKHQGVSFADLQKAMTVDGLSLGQAVRKLKQPAPAPTTGTTTTGTTTTTDSTKS